MPWTLCPNTARSRTDTVQSTWQISNVLTGERDHSQHLTTAGLRISGITQLHNRPKNSVLMKTKMKGFLNIDEKMDRKMKNVDYA